MARTGAQWRHLPDEYGKWNSVFRRYRRWVSTGVFDAMLETFAEAVERDTSADMIDSTVVRAEPAKVPAMRSIVGKQAEGHHCAVGPKKGEQDAQGDENQHSLSNFDDTSEQKECRTSVG